MIILLLILVGLLVRVYPYLPYHPLPSSYYINAIYPILHIMETGHELTLGEIETFNEYTHGIHVARDDIARNMFPSITAIVLALDEDQYLVFERFFLFMAVVLFPFCILLLYSYLCRKNGKQINHGELIFLFASTLLGNWHIITSTDSQTMAGVNALVWSFMVLAVYSLIRSKQNPNFAALFIFFIISTTLLHRTSAMFFLSVLVTMLIWRLFLQMGQKRESSQLYTSGAMVTGIVIIFAYYGYVAKDFFYVTTLMVADIATILGPHAPQIIVPYLMQGRVGMQIFRAAVILASALSLIYFSIYFLKSKYNYIGGYQVSMTLVPWVLALIPFSVAIFAWGGLVGVLSRTNQYAVVVYLAALAVILSSVKRNAAGIKWVKILLVLAMLCSMPLYLTLSEPPDDRLTYSENAAAQWLSHNTCKKDVIFTDYRLAGPLTMSGFMRTTGALVGITQREPELISANLRAIYYGGDAYEALHHINKQRIEDEPFKYLFFSRRMTEVGIKDHIFHRFKPPPQDFLDKFDKISSINKVYDNGSGMLYSRRWQFDY